MTYRAADGIKLWSAVLLFSALSLSAAPLPASHRPWFEPAVPKPLLSESTEHKLLSDLRKSDPALPEFRLWRGADNIVRGISARYTGKNGGSISLVQLKAFPALVHIDLRGAAKIDLTGAESFPDLRYLRLSGKVSGLSQFKAGKLTTLDLTAVEPESCFPFPAPEALPLLQNLLLPEEITDLRNLSCRSFRALSAPGAADFQSQCKKYRIAVQIRPRKTRNGSAESFRSVYNAKEELTAVEPVRPPRSRRAQNFSDALFPEIPQARSGVKNSASKLNLHLFTPEGKLRALSVKLAWFNNALQLTKLDLRGIPAVDCAGANLPQLKELYLSGSVRHLEELNAPKLEILHLTRVRGFLPGERRISRHLLNGMKHQRRPGSEVIRLPRSTALKELYLSQDFDEFDYNSVAGFNLQCFHGGTFQGESLDFLRGNPLKVLHLRAEKLKPDGAAVLASMPIEELNFSVSPRLSTKFLAKLKLKTLILSFPAEYKGDFTLESLANMPLEKLHLRSPRTVNYEVLKKLPLTELVLCNAELRDLSVLAALVRLENLALENCLVPDCDLAESLKQIPRLHALRLGLLYGKKGVLLNSGIQWEKLGTLPLRELSIISSRYDFFRKLPALKRVKLCLLSRYRIEPESLKFAAPPELLILCDAAMRPDRPIPDQRPGTRRPLRGSPYSNPAIAEKILTESPAIFFYGLFL